LAAVVSTQNLDRGFQNPPQAARVQAFWVWNGTDISKEGITKDLEAMRDEGLGGALIMHVGSKVANSPWPDRKYRGEYYCRETALKGENGCREGVGI
jgi:hypothetical protein